jgi:excisionase family DNA binding protein
MANYEPLMYSVPRAAELCGMGKSKFWTLVASGEIDSVRIGRARRIPAATLQEWISRKLAEATQDGHGE